MYVIKKAELTFATRVCALITMVSFVNGISKEIPCHNFRIRHRNSSISTFSFVSLKKQNNSREITTCLERHRAKRM